MGDGARVRRPGARFRLVLAAIIAAAAVAVALSTLALVGSSVHASWWQVALGAAALGLGRVPALSIRSGHHTGDYDLSEAAAVLALVLLPAPELVLATAVVVPCVHALLRKPLVKILFNGASVTVGVALAALVVDAAGGQVGQLDGADLLLTIPAGLAVCLWTTLSVTTVLAAATGQRLHQTLRDAIGRSTAIAVGNVALGCAAVALARWSPQTLIVLPPVLAGLVMVYRLHVTASKQRDSWRDLNAAARELADLDGDFVAARGQDLAMRIFQPDSVDVMIGTAGPPGTATSTSTSPAPHRLGRNRRVRRVEEVSQPLSGPAGQIGLLRLRFTEPAPWKEHEQDVLAAFANLLGLAIENARTFTEARHAAGHDELTGLGNRRLLFTSGERSLREVGEVGGRAALVLVDLDRFKEINDTLGHPSGDRLLRKVAQRLRRSVRSDDLVTRLGGDEFAVLLTGLRDTAAAESVAAALAKALASPIAVDGVSVAVEASIGLACFPDDADTVHELLRRADVAMYQAKRARCGYRRYHRDSDSSSLDHLALVADLHTALDDGEVRLRFVPRVDLASGAVTALLAVPHWDHPKLGPLPAKRFLPAVERSALAGTFTRHVLRVALDACGRWRADGHDVRVYVDLFARTLHEPDLAGDLARLLVQRGVPASGLTLVVSQPASHERSAGSPLSALSRLGVDLCLSGPQLPAPATVRDVREIEIAADVVRDVADGGPATATARATVRLAHELGLRVVARGVDHADAIDTLRVLGVDLADGPAVGRALRPGGSMGATGYTEPEAAEIPGGGANPCEELDTDGVTELLRRPATAPSLATPGRRGVVALPASRRARRTP